MNIHILVWGLVVALCLSVIFYPLMRADPPWWHFWNPQTGFHGGLILFAILFFLA